MKKITVILFFLSLFLFACQLEKQHKDCCLHQLILEKGFGNSLIITTQKEKLALKGLGKHPFVIDTGNNILYVPKSGIVHKINICNGEWTAFSKNPVPYFGEDYNFFQEIYAIYPHYYLLQTSQRLFVLDSSLQVKWDAIDSLCKKFPTLCKESSAFSTHKDNREWREFTNFGTSSAAMDEPEPLACNWHYDKGNNQITAYFKISNTDSVRLSYKFPDN